MPRDDIPLTTLPDWLTQAQQVPLASFMTHYIEQPNPAQPYIQGTKDFLKGGLSEVLKGQGVQLPDWSNRVGDILQSEAANAAIGMATPLKGIISSVIPLARETGFPRGGAELASEPAPPSIFAYHASPHDFDRFDLSKIGTGQGTQSYGSGIYAAESPAVSGRGGQYDREFTEKLRNELKTKPERRAAQYVTNYGTEESAAKALQDELSGKRLALAPGAAGDSQKALDLLNSGWKAPKAKIYEVDIKADPEHFLDWDKPLSEQSEIADKLKQGGLPPFEGKQTVADYINSSQHEMDPAEMSRFLKEAGIPGIKYLDQGSRRISDAQIESQIASTMSDIDKLRGLGRSEDKADIETLQGKIERLNKEKAQAQTRNYVVFDDKLIDILKKYGLAGLAALPAIQQQMQSRQVPLTSLPQQ